MQLRYRYRLYPAAGQCQALARAFGCARVVFNDGPRARTEAREAGLPYLSDADLSKQVIAEAKKTPGRAWLGEVSAVVLQQALADLNTAYRNFFASITGRRKGPKLAAPRFRSKNDRRQAVRFTKNARFSITPGGRLRLPKIGDVPVRWSRELPSAPSSVTVIKDAAGRYFASFVVDTSDEPLPQVAGEIGIDLGLTHFAVLSDGQKIDNPRFLRRAERRLRKAQQALSRKAKGSNNRKKAIARVAKAHASVGRRNRKPQRRRMTRCGLNPRPSGRRARQFLQMFWVAVRAAGVTVADGAAVLVVVVLMVTFLAPVYLVPTISSMPVTSASRSWAPGTAAASVRAESSRPAG
ncbi:RNA-guided endonuclease InsQ/TnpB family protein [Sphaerisporangium krabiense]|uniref:Transposase n=1 Tax=Sphaerisporangium krabiense TaxID=763782 RepID=A0A7W8YZH3_9ACTN|nr:transposase [Sphaerisporangium krabiense]MBB5624693.1 transposase [Sphaerisporangium krabiense]